MRTLKLLPILAALLLAMHGTATARQAKVLGEQELAAIFREIVLDHAAFPPENLEIVRFSARPSSLTVPDGAMGYRLVNQFHGKHLGRKSLRVAILVDGQEFGTIRMWADLQLFGEVACAAQALSRDSLLTEADIEIVRRDITFLGPGVVIDPAAAVGKKLKTSMQPGKVLYTRYLDEPPLVRRGDLVTILARSGPLEVTAPGQARGDGAAGDLIRVKNLMSRQLVQAMVQEPGMVEVEF